MIKKKENFMDKRIIFFDIDGTLLDEETSTVPLSTITAIHQARDNGHICIINTGRPISTIDQKVKDIGFDGYICGCGTYIEYHHQTIFHTELPYQLRKDLIQMIFECKVEAVLEGKNGVYFLSENHNQFINYFKQKYIEEGFQVSTFHPGDIVTFDKFTVWYDEKADIKRFKAFLNPYFEIIQRDIDFIEVVPKNHSKASGIQTLIEHLHMSLEQTISIGDSTNDLSMLSYTKESIAMGNSNPLLFDNVTYCTKHIKEDGIEHALKHFHII